MSCVLFQFRLGCWEKNCHEMTSEELHDTLRQFYAKVKNKDGDDYRKNTLMGFRRRIEHYLNAPPHNKGIKIATNTAFKKSNMMLDAKIKSLKQQGKENIQHKPPITLKDLQKLKVSSTFSPSSPLGLLRNVWFHIAIYWCRRGREGQRSLAPSSFKFEEDEEGRPYATMAHDETSKNHQGGLHDIESHEKEGRMYQTGGRHDGYDALRLYLSKLNPKCTAFFQFPKQNWSSKAEVAWYENRPLGVNKLGSMMKESLPAKLSMVYTNHSVRATAITLWSNAGLANRHIMAISGHRNEQSLSSYNARPSSTQLQHCSDVISEALSPNGQQNPPSQQGLASSSSTPPANIITSHQLHHGSMFTGCTIGSIQVFVNQSGNNWTVKLLVGILVDGF